MREGSTLPYGERDKQRDAKVKDEAEGWHPAPEGERTPPSPSSSASSWVGPAGSEEVQREHTPYPSLDEDAKGIVLTLGWIEQVLQLSFGREVNVRVAGVGKQWKLRLTEAQIVDIVSSLAHYVRAAMPHGGTLTVHAMPLDVKSAEEQARLGLAAGKYIFMGISHTASDGAAADSSGERPVRARVGLDTVYRIVNELGGALSVDRKAQGMTAMNMYLPRIE